MFLFAILILPDAWATTCDSSLIWAVPPTWNVLIVNWVPGSPIDWAAIIPIASPSATSFPRDKSLPYDIAQTPFFEPQVITEYTFTDLTPAASIFSQISSLIISFLFNITSPVIGCFMSSNTTLPNILSDKLTIMLPPSIISDIVKQSFVLQSQLVLVIDISWATSQSLLVK